MSLTHSNNHTPSALDQLSLEQIRLSLQNPSPVTYDIPGDFQPEECKPAAVLIPFVNIRQAWHLVFIRRSIHEYDHHSGQVAFAGGKFETADIDLKATAKREAHEEIGLSPKDVTVLGELEPHYSITRFSISPVVGHIPWPYDFTLDKTEVAKVFTIPLSWLSDPINHRVEYKKLGKHKEIPVTYFEKYDGEFLWGATARMTLSLISLLKTQL